MKILVIGDGREPSARLLREALGAFRGAGAVARAES